MGAQFTAASSQVLANTSSVITGFPVVLACWTFIIDTAADYASASVASTLNITNFINLSVPTLGPAFAVVCNDGSGAQTITSNILPVAGRWYFMMTRAVSATSKWIIVYDPATGRADQVQNTVSKAPTLTSCNVGIGGQPGSALASASNNIIAEFFYMDSDFNGTATGTALAAEFVRSLALEGPFARTEMQANIVEYRSLRLGVDTARQVGDSVSTGLAYSRIGRTTWANPFTAANVPIDAPHPPLSTNYVRPGQIRPIVVI